MESLSPDLGVTDTAMSFSSVVIILDLPAIEVLLEENLTVEV
jgi:hypothetical protein